MFNVIFWQNGEKWVVKSFTMILFPLTLQWNYCCIISECVHSF